MRGYEYNPLITHTKATPEEMLAYLEDWYADSCGLRFIEAVSSDTGFESLVEQDFVC
jgi:hypothetical protein